MAGARSLFVHWVVNAASGRNWLHLRDSLHSEDGEDTTRSTMDDAFKDLKNKRF